MKNKYKEKLVHRSFLFTPGHNEKFISKSFFTDADAIVFDLEDAVPSNKKKEARQILKSFLTQEMPDDRPLYVRINPIESGMTLLDLDAVVSPNINGFVYPMSSSAHDMIAFGAQLSLKETELGLPKNYFDIIALVETPKGVHNIKEITEASSRIIGILFGSEDFLAKQGGRHGPDGRGIAVPRHLIAMAAKAAGVLAIDTPYVDIENYEGLEAHINQALDFGFDGMGVMTPKQIPIIHKMYSPEVGVLEKAHEIAEIHAEAEKNNKGITVKNGIFVSPPTLKNAQRVLKRETEIKNYIDFIKSSKKTK